MTLHQKRRPHQNLLRPPLRSGHQVDSSLKNAAIISLVLFLTFSYALLQKHQITSLSGEEGKNLMVKTLPSFKVHSLSSGQDITSEGLGEKGQGVLVIHFWATWCAPCLTEFPELVKLASRFHHNPEVQFFLTAVRDKKADVEKFVKKFGPFPPNVHLALDPEGQMMNSFGTVKVPETHYYLKKRSIKRLIGPQEWDNPYFYDQLKGFVGPPPSLR